MIIIACVDNNGGILFNNRRQSSDRQLRSKVLEICSGSKLWMNAYTAKQFSDLSVPEINVEESFIENAQPGDFCFVENTAVLPYEQQIERIILFKWNRDYPADMFFDIPLKSHGWQITNTEDFTGYSHEKITMEVYEK